jgi:hypothetical protein
MSGRQKRVDEREESVKRRAFPFREFSRYLWPLSPPKATGCPSQLKHLTFVIAPQVFLPPRIFAYTIFCFHCCIPMRLQKICPEMLSTFALGGAKAAF